MKSRIVLAVALGALATGTGAQAQQGRAQATEKRLYCWDEGGRRVCGDALPPDAVDAARTEISARSGLRVGEVGRALTPEERAAAEAAEREAKLAAEAEAARRRRELAMAVSYDT